MNNENAYQTQVPKHRYAKAFGVGLRVSQKSSSIICKAIKNKPLDRARRLLEDLKDERRSLDGKYYTKAVKEILNLVNSCEKNAENIGLDTGKLFVRASASKGGMIHRRRRKGAFGNTMKNTHIEILLVERGKESKKISAKKIKEQLLGKEHKEHHEHKPEHQKEIEELKQHSKETKEQVEHTKEHQKQRKKPTQEEHREHREFKH